MVRLSPEQLPVQVPHHEALEIGWYQAIEGGPCDEPVLLSVWLVAGLPVELGVPQSYTDVIQQTWQGTKLQNSVLGDKAEMKRCDFLSQILSFLPKSALIHFH